MDMYIQAATVLVILVYDFTSQGKLRHTVDATKPMVALTYDDGPSTQNTQIILDTLTANGAYATFFVLGRNVERCADIIYKKDAIVWRSAHCCILFCFRKRSLSYYPK
mgnify:CR=1 FL=1